MSAVRRDAALSNGDPDFAGWRLAGLSDSDMQFAAQHADPRRSMLTGPRRSSSSSSRLKEPLKGIASTIVFGGDFLIFWSRLWMETARREAPECLWILLSVSRTIWRSSSETSSSAGCGNRRLRRWRRCQCRAGIVRPCGVGCAGLTPSSEGRMLRTKPRELAYLAAARVTQLAQFVGGGGDIAREEFFDNFEAHLKADEALQEGHVAIKSWAMRS